MILDSSEVRIVISHLQLTAAKHLAAAKYACVLGAAATLLQQRALGLECHKAQVLAERLELLFTRFLPNDSRDAQRALRTIQYEALIEEHDAVMDQYQMCVNKRETLDRQNAFLGDARCRQMLTRAITLLTAAKRLRATI